MFLPPLPTALLSTLPSTGSSTETFARIINLRNRQTQVHITIFNDEGEVIGRRNLSLNPRSAVHFNSHDLIQGSTELGWTDSFNWNRTYPDFLRMELREFLKLGGSSPSEVEGSSPSEPPQNSDGVSPRLNFSAKAYSRTTGYSSSVHSLHKVRQSVKSFQPQNNSGGHNYKTIKKMALLTIDFFNPASNTTFESKLRLINRGRNDLAIRITGVDSAGHFGAEDVSFSLEGKKSKTITARQLEEGDSSFNGKLGDGTGKWRLSISISSKQLPSSSENIEVMNLMETPGGGLFSID